MTKGARSALIADIGGTHARFALVDADGRIGPMEVLRCREFAGPAEAATAFFLRRPDAPPPSVGAFAVASPLTGDRVTFTNSAWDFSIEAVRRALRLDRLEVVNDFTAVALSIGHLAPADLVALGGGTAVPDTPVAILGPGTGLGVSGLVPAPGGGWVPLTTEGGHVTMAAANEREDRVLAWLRGQFGHVSAERVLSGPGLVNLYHALTVLAGRSAEPNLAPPEVLDRAAQGTCTVAAEALDMFFDMMGTAASNLALSLGARGGIYVAGGILPRVAGAFAASGFRARFEEKGRFRPYLAAIPAWLIVHPEPAFQGLAGLCK